MRLLFDANLSPVLASRLADVFPDSEHVGAFGLTASDLEIWEYAKSSGLTIVTKDTDFLERAIVHGGPPKVVLVRLGNCRTNVVESLIRQRSRELAEMESDPETVVLSIP